MSFLFKPQGGGGSGSGFGGINYISNPNASSVVLPWVTYADAAQSTPVNGVGGTPNITLTRDTNSLTIGQTSFLVTKDAANRQGEGISCDFAIDPVVQGTPVDISFFCAPSANFAYGNISGTTLSDLAVYVYSVDDSALVGVFPYVITNEGYFTGQFQATQATNYRLILHIGTTSALAWTFALGEVIVTPSQSNFIQSDSDWVSYTPTFTGFGTVTNVNVYWKKEGSDLLIRAKFTSGTPTATEARMSLPNSLNSSSTLSTIQWAADITYNNNSANQKVALIEPSVSYLTFGSQGASVQGLSKQNANSFIDSTSTVSFTARVPIQGWTSGYATPAVSAQNVPAVFRATKSGGSITLNTTIPSWSVVDKDSVGAFDATTGVYTVKVPGDYIATFQFIPSANSTVTGGVFLNGVQKSITANESSTIVKSGAITMLVNCVVGDQITTRLDTSVTLAAGTNTVFQIYKIESPSAFLNIPKIATLKDVKANGTAGGTFISGSYQTRVLNTLDDPFGIVSLSANQFTLQAGTYYMDASAPAGLVDGHRIRIRNITDSTTDILGGNAYTASANASAGWALLDGRITISSAKTFELQHRCQTTKNTDGFGAALSFSESETYSVLKIQKLL